MLEGPVVGQEENLEIVIRAPDDVPLFFEAGTPVAVAHVVQAETAEAMGPLGSPSHPAQRW